MQEEIRKERKRQSNREWAKRRRIRKQQEYEELHKSVSMLSDEIPSLKKEVIRLYKRCKELSKENNSIQEEIVKKYGLESTANLWRIKPDSFAGGEAETRVKEAT